MVDAEVCALGALEEDSFSTPDRCVEPRRRIRDERRETRSVLDLLFVDCFQIEAFRPAVRIDEPLLDRDDRLDLLSEGERINEVAHADAEPTHLVLEGRADSPKRGAGSQDAFQFLLEPVDDLVVRHHDVRAVADAQVLH